MSDGNHFERVVILGAGASSSSGYPIQNELRVRISSDYLKEEYGKFAGSAAPFERLSASIEDLSEALRLCRQGGFATVDEFSKLATRQFESHVINVKRAIRLLFALHNPEDQFEKSDYYPFVQRCFLDENLAELRPNLTVLSFNYDNHLDYVLHRAWKVRQVMAGKPTNFDAHNNKLTSGFWDVSDQNGIEATGFNYYKLHGSISFPRDTYFGFETLFRHEAAQRLLTIADGTHPTLSPPIIFPWECFTESGDFIQESEFVLVRHPNLMPSPEVGKSVFKLLKTLWENARLKVANAERISFVGVSMHAYLEHGLRFLLRDCKKSVQIVIANPNTTFYQNNPVHPLSVSGKTISMLRKVAPHLTPTKSVSDDDGTVDLVDPIPNGGEPEWGVTLRPDFLKFIEADMD